MCTSLTYETADSFHFLARTMDFAFLLNGRPLLMPRGYRWLSELGDAYQTRYGFVGAGRELEGFFFADGVNEKGLAICELYFPGEASYETQPKTGKVNLAPHELVTWLLGEIGSVQELRERFSELVLTDWKFTLLDKVLPLHYIVTDPTGACVVIEPMGEGMRLKDNPVGVMTNSPELEWHLKNLNNMLGLQTRNFPEGRLGALTLSPFGQGSGSYGLPGGYTPPERFMRTAFFKEHTHRAEGLEAGIATILEILNPVTIPKGINLNAEGTPDYTQYRSIMSLEQTAYYFNNHGTNEILKVVLTEELMNRTSPTSFEAKTELTFSSPA